MGVAYLTIEAVSASLQNNAEVFSKPICGLPYLLLNDLNDLNGRMEKEREGQKDK